MKLNKFLKAVGITLSAVVLIWVCLTWWVERVGPEKRWEIGSVAGSTDVLIVYDPDPIYNLDEQVCWSFGKALADHGAHVNVMTVAAAQNLKQTTFGLYVFCANTYNWRPDRAVSNFIREQTLKNKPVIAITVGSGSTESSQKILESLIKEKEADLWASRSLWLMRPNDESRMEESNVQVAVSSAYTWGEEVAARLKSL